MQQSRAVLGVVGNALGRAPRWGLGPSALPCPTAGVNTTVAHVGGGFRRMLINMYLSGEMTAKKVVRIAFLAMKSGATGCEEFAKDIKHDRNCSRLLRSVLRFEEVASECLHSTEMPVNRSRPELKRRAVRKSVSTIPVFEVFARQFSRDPHSFLAHRTDPDLLCDNFYSHDLVSRYGAHQGIPCRIFADFAVLDRQALRIS